MEHKPIAIMILSVFVMGILMLGTLVATVNAQESGPASGADQQTILNAHDRERSAGGVPALVWSESLASDASAWLNKMVAQNNGVVWPSEGVKLLRHDPSLRTTNQGENLAFSV